MNNKINILDLFSGIGGFSKGFLDAGWDVKNHFFSEIDKYAIGVYKHNFKNSKHVGSVTNVQGADLPKINLITFGSPCQDFSLAGKRRGMDGERSSLILEAVRLIRECQPDFFIWENVKGAFSSNEGRDFQGILREFANLGNYRLEWQLLNTKWFLPQNRERIYLVGHIAKPKRHFRQVFPIRKNIEGLNERAIQATNTLTAGGNSGGLHSSMTLIKSATSKGYEIAKDGDSINLSNPNSKTRRGRVGKGVAQTLETSCNQAVVSYSMGNSRPGRSCIGTRVPEVGNSNGSIRRLTPIECERLQGFPDDWTSKGLFDNGEKEISDTQRYKMCGNAVSVPVVREIAKQLINIYIQNGSK